MSAEKTIDTFDILSGQPGAKFVQLLLKNSLINDSQLEKAVRIQKKLGNKKVLSHILIELGLITEDEKKTVVARTCPEFPYW